MDRTLILAENHDIAPGSFDDMARTLLAGFEGHAWDAGHTAALITYVSTNSGTEQERTTHALQVGLKTALDESPQGDRKRLDDEAKVHYAHAYQRYQASLPSRAKRVKDGAK